MNNIIFLSQELINFLGNNSYKESTLKKYKRELNVLKRFLEENGTAEYTIELGDIYANDVYINNMFSAQRFFDRGRLTRLLNSYLINGYFDLSIKQGKKFDDLKIRFQSEYDNYKSYIDKQDLKVSTKHNYCYEVYSFLDFLSSTHLTDLDVLSANDIYAFLSQIQPNQQRHALCGIRSYLNFINRNDLLQTIKGIQSPRTKRIISILTNEENEKIQEVLKSEQISNRDRAIFLLGYTLGIRACDIVALKLEDIKWDKEYIEFFQAKTGNQVRLPLTVEIGNALFLYLTTEREKSNSSNVFISHYPPYNPLRDHSACYSIIKKILDLANISKENRFFGTHFLRHNAASSFVMNGVQLETIAAILGHSDPNSTNVYLSVNSDKLKECTLSMKDIGMAGESYE